MRSVLRQKTMLLHKRQFHIYRRRQNQIKIAYLKHIKSPKLIRRKDAFTSESSELED